MELRRMRYFVAVAEELHFRRAAERLHISTPSLSQQIKAVEREIGGPLLIRGPEGVSLTAAGEALLRSARTVLAAADEAVREAREVAGTAGDVLRFGLLNGVPPRLTARVTGRFAGRVDMTSGTTAVLSRLLAAGRLDLAMLRAPVALAAGLRAVHVADEEMGILMSKRHQLAAGGRASGPVTVAELAGREMILFPPESAPQLHVAILGALAGVALSTSAMGHAQMLGVLPLRPDVFGLSSDRAVGIPGLVWRPIEGRPVVVEYVAAWPAHQRRAEALVAG